MKLSNVRKKNLNLAKVLSNVTLELSNVRKNRRTTKCDKITVTYDVGTINMRKNKGTAKCDKKTFTCDVATA